MVRVKNFNVAGKVTIFVNGALLAFSKGDPIKVVSYGRPSEP